MKSITSHTMLIVTLSATVAIGFGGLVVAQTVYAQGSTPAQDLVALLTAITGIITTLAALAGGIIASYAKTSQKIGLARDDQITKLLSLATELQNTDHWNKEIEERLVTLGDVIEVLPGGRETLEQKRVDLKRWNEEASKLNAELGDIYKALMPLLQKR